jgi:hypothetical protein
MRMAPSSWTPATAQRVRFVLGMAQMFAATVSVAALALLGVSRFTLYCVVFTSLLTTISVLLFGGRHR